MSLGDFAKLRTVGLFVLIILKIPIVICVVHHLVAQPIFAFLFLISAKFWTIQQPLEPSSLPLLFLFNAESFFLVSFFFLTLVPLSPFCFMLFSLLELFILVPLSSPILSFSLILSFFALPIVARVWSALFIQSPPQ